MPRASNSSVARFVVPSPAVSGAVVPVLSQRIGRVFQRRSVPGTRWEAFSFSRQTQAYSARSKHNFRRKLSKNTVAFCKSPPV